jgi:DNA polymerase-1
MMAPVLALLADPRKKVVAQNAKYDANAVYSHFGIFVRGLHFDTMLAKKILEPESGAGLDLIQEGVGMGGGKEIAVRELARIGRAIKKANSDTALSEIGNVSWARKIKVDKSLHKTYAYGLMDADTCDRYCARDTVSTDKAASMLEARLSEVPSVQMVWEKILRPAAEAIEHVERWGIKVDMGRVAKFDESLQKELGLILSRIYSKKEFRLGSLVELREFLYKRHKLPVVKKTPKGLPSTDAETLNSLLDRSLKPAQRVVVEDLLAYRKLEKLHSTYAAKMGAFMRGDGRVHPSFNLVGARSGRMSCSKPSLQQIPRAATKIAAMARGCFVAPPGRVFVQLDYSQLELRVVAMLSGDENMIEVFKSGVDYHLRTAQLVSKRAWGIAPEDVTKEHRTMAKGISFGLLYGMGLGTLAKNMGATQDEAEKIQKAIFGNFPKMKKWCDDHLKLAREKGYTVTYWDGKPARIRPLFGIASSDDKARSTAENGSFNTPVQGTASDMCVVALTRCVNWLLDTGFPAKLVLTVHDSLMFEVDEDRALELVSVVRGLMTDFPSNGVPIVVDAEIGPDWGQLEPLKEGDLA